MKNYRSMTMDELVAEAVAWDEVAQAPKEPGNASNGAREEAQRQSWLAEAWYHRRKMEDGV